MKITTRNVTGEQYIMLLGAAVRAIESFMEWDYSGNAAPTYSKIKHIRVLKQMFDTDLKLAKDVVDLAHQCWKNEHPVSQDDALRALREKLGYATEDEVPFW